MEVSFRRIGFTVREEETSPPSSPQNRESTPKTDDSDEGKSVSSSSSSSSSGLELLAAVGVLQSGESMFAEGVDHIKNQKYKDAFQCLVNAACRFTHYESLFLLRLLFSCEEDFFLARSEYWTYSKELNTNNLDVTVEDIFSFYRSPQNANRPFAKLCLCLCHFMEMGPEASINEGNRLMQEMEKDETDPLILYIFGKLKFLKSIEIADEEESKEVLNQSRTNFQRAADQGLVLADQHLGKIAQDQGDAQLAYRHYEKAANAGIGLAQYLCGGFHAFSIGGFVQNNDEAIKWYKMALDQGLPQAKYNLYALYNNGVRCDIDQKQAEHLLLDAAVCGFCPAEFELAQGLLQDNQAELVAQGRFFMTRAAEKGYHNAVIALGDDALQREDYPEALKWYQTGVQLEIPETWIGLGGYYADHDCPDHDYEKAYDCLKIALEKGTSGGIMLLAHVCLCTKRFHEAIHYFEQEGNYHGLFELYSSSVITDFNKALECLKKLDIRDKGKKERELLAKIEEHRSLQKKALSACKKAQDLAALMRDASAEEKLLYTLSNRSEEESELLKLYIQFISKKALKGLDEDLAKIQKFEQEIASPIVNDNTILRLSELEKSVTEVWQEIRDDHKERLKLIKDRAEEIKKEVEIKKQREKILAEIKTAQETMRTKISQARTRLGAALDRLLARFDTRTGDLLTKVEDEETLPSDDFSRELVKICDETLTRLMEISRGEPSPTQALSDPVLRIRDLEGEKRQLEKDKSQLEIALHTADREMKQQAEAHRTEREKQERAFAEQMNKQSSALARQTAEIEALKKYLREKVPGGSTILLIEEASMKINELTQLVKPPFDARKILAKLEGERQNDCIAILSELGYQEVKRGKTAGSHKSYSHATLETVTFSGHGENPEAKVPERVKVFKLLIQVIDQQLAILK
jgi:TPR repeat protein/predicted RNA binding protein YcfA (HicA-like mRNA interferase family)